MGWVALLVNGVPVGSGSEKSVVGYFESGFFFFAVARAIATIATPMTS